MQMELVTQSFDNAAGGATQGLQAAKGFASRGLAGLKAAREAMKSGGGDKVGGLMTGLQAAVSATTGTSVTLLKFTGPGRVGIQSMYVGFGSG